MPIKSGKQTSKERAFIEHAVALGDPVAAARLAGYAQPSAAAVQNMQRPAVVSEVKRRQEERMTNELLPAAVDLLHHVLTDATENTRNRIAAAKIVVDRTIGAQMDGNAKEPHEMTADELAERMAQLRQQQAALADQARDVTPPDEGQDSDAFG